MSQQVYSNLQNALAYNGPAFATQFTLTANAGAPPATCFIGVQLARINPGQVLFTINGAQSNVNYDALTTQVSAPAGTIPLAFRPVIDQYLTVYTSVPTGPSRFAACSLLLGADGRIIIRMFDPVGVPISFLANQEFVPGSWAYPANA